MLRAVLLVAVALAVALGGGTASVWLAVHRGAAIPRTIGWEPAYASAAAPFYRRLPETWPFALPLGPNEGAAFIAWRSEDGSPLRADCDYRINAPPHPSRFWTLVAADPLRPLDPTADRGRIQAMQTLRTANQGIVLVASPHPTPGNWLPLRGAGPIALVLSLYGTRVTNSVSLAERTLPRIMRLRCDA